MIFRLICVSVDHPIESSTNKFYLNKMAIFWNWHFLYKFCIYFIFQSVRKFFQMGFSNNLKAELDLLVIDYHPIQNTIILLRYPQCTPFFRLQAKDHIEIEFQMQIFRIFANLAILVCFNVKSIRNMQRLGFFVLYYRVYKMALITLID